MGNAADEGEIAERMKGLSATQYQTRSLVSRMGSCVSELLEGTWMVHFLCVVSEPLFCLGDTEEWPLFILTTVSDLHFTFFF